MEMYCQGRHTIILKKKKGNVQSNLNSPTTLLSLSLSFILSGILGFPKLKIIFNLANELHIGRIVF